MPIPPESPAEKTARMKKEFDTLTERRKAMLAAEEELHKRRAEAQKEERARGEQTYVAEVTAAKERGVEREEWRQEQHQKREEELHEKLRIEEEKKHQLVLQQKKEAEEQKKKANMVALHDVAVERKIAARVKILDKAESDTDKHVDEQTARAFEEIDAELQRSLIAITRNAQKAINEQTTLLDRRRKMIDDTYVRDRRALLSETRRQEAGQKKMLIESTRKRQLMALEQELQEHAVKLSQETARLEREAKALAQQKKQRLQADALRRKQEAHKRHETGEKWIGLEKPEDNS